MEELLNKLNAHAGELNISIVVPIENEPFDKETNQKRVRAAIDEAVEKVLNRRTDYYEVTRWSDDLYHEIDWDHPAKA